MILLTGANGVVGRQVNEAARARGQTRRPSCGVSVAQPAGEEPAEELVVHSGLEWTVLRPADFAANALAWAPQIKAGDVIRGAYGEAATSPIHETDVAMVAVQALRGGPHADRPTR